MEQKWNTVFLSIFYLLSFLFNEASTFLRSFVAQSWFSRLVASWHDNPQGRQDALQDHQLDRVQRCAQSPGIPHDLAGQRRTFERQVAELHLRVALLNRFTQLGRPTTVPVVAMA